MSENYLPFFRKYRPQAFCDLIGQENLVKALTNAIELNRFANAYLFCGPRGTGKTSSARILAKSLNCEKGPTASPCQKCPSCVDITNTSGLDVIEIDAATNRGIDDAKDLISQVQYAPINGKYKIFIIDEVHMLSKEAFNALLKTFEEPPENVIFILATTEPHKVIETIVSRCQRFDFRRITVDDIVLKLREIAGLEKIKITDDALLTIAKNVSGGMRDSLALLDQVAILGAKDEITKDLIDALVGKITFEPMFNLLETINGANIESALIQIEEIFSKGSEPRNFVENFIEFLRNFTIVINSNNPDTVAKFTNLNKSDIQKILENKENYPKNSLALILNKAIEFYKEIKNSTNPYLWCELMVIEMCTVNGISAAPALLPVAIPSIEPQIIQKIETIKPVPKQVETVEKEIPPIQVQTEPEPEPAFQPQPEAAVESQPQSVAEIDTDEVWSRIISAIKSPFVKGMFENVPLSVEVADSTITIGCLNQSAIEQLKSKLSALEEAMENVLETKFSVNFIQVEKSEIKKPLNFAPQKPAPTFQYDKTQAPTQVQPAQPKDDENNEDKIPKIYSDKTKAMLETFSGKVVD